jgi:hypothetical protein
VTGRLDVRRDGDATFERWRADALDAAPGDVLAPANGRPAAFQIDDEVTVALRPGARLRVARRGTELHLDLERGACAVETLGLPRALRVRTPRGELVGAVTRCEVWAGADDTQAAVAEGTAELVGAEGRATLAPGQGAVCTARGPGRVQAVDPALLARWAESVMPACDRCGRAGARCPVCLRARQILEWRLATLGGGGKGKKPGAPAEDDETDDDKGDKKDDKKDDDQDDPKSGPPAPPPPPVPPPPGPGAGGPPPGPGPGPGGPPPGPGPGGPPPGAPPGPPAPPAGPPVPPAAPGTGEDGAGDDGDDARKAPVPPAAGPERPPTPQERHFHVPEHLLTRELPACCRHGRSRCWQIIRKYGPALPWPWPPAAAAGDGDAPRKEHR